MIKEIENNAFRIFGLPANAGRSVIEKQYQKLNSKNHINKAICEAYQALISPDTHWRHALYWFVSVFDEDKIAIRHFEQGQFDLAIRTWEKSLNYVTTHNLMVCYLQLGSEDPSYYKKALFYAKLQFLNEQYFNDLMECVGDEQKHFSSDIAYELLDMIFSQERVNKVDLFLSLEDKKWMGYVNEKWMTDEERTHCKEQIKAITIAKELYRKEEHSRNVTNWIWWITFPIILIGFYTYKCNREAEKDEKFHELMKPMDEKIDTFNVKNHFSVDSNMVISVDNEYIEHTRKK